jgi:hypothetical protein
MRKLILLAGLCLGTGGTVHADVGDQGPLAAMVAPAIASRPAVRLDPPQGNPCSDVAAERVAALPYGWTVPGPIVEAFRIVAKCNGWSQQTIDSWAPFAEDVFMREGNGCWNVRGNDVFAVGSCTEYVQHGNGSAEDSGPAQLTSSIWGVNGKLCLTYGYCSGASVRADAWTAMDAVVKTFHLYGSQPWCYNAFARNVHNCTLVNREERP